MHLRQTLYTLTDKRWRFREVLHLRATRRRAAADELAGLDGSYAEAEIEITKTSDTLSNAITLSSFTNLTKITITGRSTTIRSNPNTRHFILDTASTEFELSGVTLAGDSGGGVRITDGEPKFDGVTFSRINAADNSETDDQNGGAAGITSGTATFTNCTFTGCAATNGGALYVEGGEVTVSGGTFDGGTATTTENGGVMYIAGGRVNVSGSELKGATVSDNGGALYVSGGTLTFSGTMAFSGNKASNGGAIYFAGGTLAFPGSTAYILC